MKKILSILCLSFILTNVTLTSKLFAAEEYPIYSGDLQKIEYKVVQDGPGYAVILIDGKPFIVIKPN